MFGLLAFLVIAVLVVLVLYLAPSLLVGPDDDLSTAEKLQAENDVRTTLLQALVGIAFLTGAYFTGRTYFSNRESTLRQFELDREGQVTERFTKAIDQLGNRGSLDVRLGGIYALERIAQESERDHWPIVEVLTAFVREWPSRAEAENAKPQDTESRTKLDPDVQAALTVLGRRTVDFDDSDRRLDLVQAELRFANLWEANLEGANFTEANLTGAFLPHANLRGAWLNKANLTGANLTMANPMRADFTEANLTGADFTEANLTEAWFTEANLTGAWLTGANLEDAHFTKANLEGAHLSHANLAGAWFTGANLTGADFTEANLEGAKLSKVSLKNADLETAVGLTLERLKEADTEGAKLPPELR